MSRNTELIHRLQTLLNQECITADSYVLEQAERLMRHEFNCLGSGWVHNCYGMQACGFQNINYSDLSIKAENVRAEVPEWYKEKQNRCMRLIEYYGKDYVPIDWQIDIKSGARYTIRHIHDITFGKVEGMDAKMPSELSRFYHLVVLARAYKVSGDARYRKEILLQILDWWTVHPFEYGAGWRANMNVAIRTVNWLTALSLIADSFDINCKEDMAFLDILFESLLEHRRYISKYLEFTENPSCLHPNHYIADVCGLLVISAFLHELDPDAEGWYILAKRELAATLKYQINDDGLDFESTTMYHAFALEMVSVGMLLSARLTGAKTAEEQSTYIRKEFGGECFDRIHSMFIALRDLIQPNRRIPVVGDADSGRFLVLEGGCRHDTDRVCLCGVGAALYNDASILPEGFEDSDWIYAESIINDLDKKDKAIPGSQRSREFTTSGFYVLRNDDAYSFISCAPIGTCGKGAHSHNDRLETLLSVKGEDIIIDPGVYAYTASMKYRNLFRDVGAHATVCINSVQPNRLNPEGCWWGYRDDTQCKCISFVEKEGITSFIGEHYAYHRFEIPVTVRRAVDLENSKLMIIDSFMKDRRFGNDMSVEYTFMLGCNCTVFPKNDEVVEIQSGNVVVTAATENGKWIVEDGFFAPMYGAIGNTKRLRIHFDTFIEANKVCFCW